VSLLKVLTGLHPPFLRRVDRWLALRSPRDPAAPRIVLSMDRRGRLRFGFRAYTYFRLIRRGGGIPMKVDYGSGPEPEDIDPIAASMMERADGLILTGGGDVDPELYDGPGPSRGVKPERDRFELALIRHARQRGLPVLGICRGCQLLSVATGGRLHSLREDPRRRRYHNRWRAHPVQIEPDSRLASIVGQSHLSHVRSLHGQAVHQPGPDTRIVARAPDGIHEAIERVGDERSDPEAPWLIGVQWHPELMLFRNREHRLIDAFVQRAAVVAADHHPAPSD